MNEHIEQGSTGDSFEDFLQEQGTYEDTTERAIKRVLAFQLTKAMEEKNISKAKMAKRLHTSRSQLDRLLDPNNSGVTLSVLSRAATAVGRTIRLELV
jgi:antitoxin HicB